MTTLVDLLFWPVVGGVLIGLSAALLMLWNGRIAGVSGIFGGALSFPAGDSSWRWAFTAGLVAGGAVLLSVADPSTFANSTDVPPLGLAVAGLLVGVGTRIGSGCTSGHGICGLARFSPRSVVSVLTFIAAGAVTVFLVRHVF